VGGRDFWIATYAVIAIRLEHPAVNMLGLALPLGLSAKPVVLPVELVDVFGLAFSSGLPVKMIVLFIKLLRIFMAALFTAAASLFPSEICIDASPLTVGFFFRARQLSSRCAHCFLIEARPVVPNVLRTHWPSSLRIFPTCTGDWLYGV